MRGLSSVRGSACCGISLPQRGVVGPWVLVALLALLGMTALVVDVGRLVVVAQRTQEVVDAAALAGAAKLPEQVEAEASLQQIVAANNTEASPWQVSVTPEDDVNYYEPGDTVEGYGDLEDDENAVEVVGHATVAYTFARIFGIESAEVTRVATALRKEGDSGAWPAIFVYDNSDTKSVWWTGSGGWVAGDIHTNGGMKASGSNHTVEGVVEYGTQFVETGGGHDWQGGVRQADFEDWPAQCSIDDFGSPTQTINGDLKVTGSDPVPFIAPGVYHVTGDVKISGSGVGCHDCVFIVDGDVDISGSGHNFENVSFAMYGDFDISGSGHNFTAAVEDIFAYSLSDSIRAMDVSGSGGTWIGAFFAPSGGIEFTGSGHELQRGSLICKKRVKVTGSGFHLYGTDGGGGGSAARIELIQ